jgi:hypothetical protein
MHDPDDIAESDRFNPQCRLNEATTLSIAAISTSPVYLQLSFPLLESPFAYSQFQA